MDLYFFNLQGEKSIAMDLVGRRLRSQSSARSHAADFASGAARVEEEGGPAFRWVEVLDQGHRPLFRLPIDRDGR